MDVHLTTDLGFLDNTLKSGVMLVSRSVDWGEVIEKQLPAGRYAVISHKGPREQINEEIYWLYREWLPGSKEELGDLPCIFCYYNFEYEVAETELLTEVWVLLK